VLPYFLQLQVLTTARPENVPSGLDIERFIESILTKLKPHKGRVPSWSYIKHGIRAIIQSTIFQYPTFTLSPHDRIRLKSQCHRLLHEGRITKELIREAQWVGAYLLQKMVVALYYHDVNTGTHNWDWTIQRALGLVLMGALSCRSGDIMKDVRDTHHLPFLCYNDIHIAFEGGEGIEHLVARITIRNEKGKK
jgi:hypothetical protein